MWIISDRGFFSAVQKHGDNFLTVRTRVKQHAQNLAVDLGKQDGASTPFHVITGEGTDYPYRLRVSHEAFAKWLTNRVNGITYSNFKSHLATIGMRGFEHLCHEVWSVFFHADKACAKDKAA